MEKEGGEEEDAGGEGREGCDDDSVDAWLTLAAVASKLEALCVTKVFPRCGVYHGHLMEVRHRGHAAECILTSVY